LSTGKTTNITVGHGKTGVCITGSTIVARSGSHFIGTGGTVKALSTVGYVFWSDDVDSVSFDQMSLDVPTIGPASNYWNVVGIYYYSAGDGGSTSHANFSITNTKIHGATYGVIINVSPYNPLKPDGSPNTSAPGYGASHQLQNVTLSKNQVYCDLNPVTNRQDIHCRDGLHVAGNVATVVMDSNNVWQRDDAAYALSSTGGAYSSDFPGHLAQLTPSNVTISNNIGTDDCTCLDFSGGHGVSAVDNTCINRVPFSDNPGGSGSCPSLRFVYGGALPLPSNITVSGGTFSNNASGGPPDTSNVKMDFSGYGVNGEYPVCNCTIENHAQIGGPLSGLVWMLGNTFTIDNSAFAANTHFYVEAESGVATNKIVVSNSFWSSPRYIIPTSIPGGISNSYLINDSYNGKTTSSTAIKYPWREP
jgi:hypothetical protein